MLIGLILTIWLFWALLFCFGLCAAAARPMPQPDAIAHVETLQPINCHV